MLEKLESLRTQPKYIRNRYAFWTASMLTLIIASFWLTSLPSRFAPQVTQTATPAVAGSSFWNTFGKIIQDIKNSPNSFKGTSEYTQQEHAQPQERPHLLDLQALVASSTQTKKASIFGSSTASSTLEMPPQKTLKKKASP